VKLTQPFLTLNQLIAGAASLLILITAAIGLFIWGRARIGEAVYRDRLKEICSRYESLRESYNDVVRRSAVAELVCENGRLSVAYRVGPTTVETVPLPFDPDQEIYVDFVVLDGRLLIRRVFSEDTPPNAGVVLNADLLGVDWDRPDAQVGKAVYRRLSQGRWTVTVTGNGSLGLDRAPDKPDGNDLALNPPVRNYDRVAGDIRDATDSITVAEVAGALVRTNRQP
jgi:hypothetical protein